MTNYESRPEFRLEYFLILDKFVKGPVKSETFVINNSRYLKFYDISLPLSQHPSSFVLEYFAPDYSRGKVPNCFINSEFRSIYNF